MKKTYSYELHSHTSEVSSCARVPAAESYRFHEKCGLDGMVVTDHFYHDALQKFGSDYESRIDGYLQGYNKIKSLAREGFSGLFGLEFRFSGSPNDYLIFGASPKLIRAEKDLDLYDRDELRAFADRNGLLIVQAHPFRSPCTPDKPDFLDGAEVFNGHPYHDSQNALALEFAKKNGLMMTSGSDFHEPPMLARGGIETDTPITSEKELVEILKSGNYRLRRTVTTVSRDW